MKSYSTIVDVLRDRAATTPDRLAYSFVSETPTNFESFTYGQLETKVKAIAAHLQTKVKKGDRILLLFPYSDGLEFVASFYACSYAGAVAVTINPSKSADALDKLLERIENSQAKAVVTTSEVINYFKGKLAKNPLKSVGVATKFSHLELVEMDKISLNEAGNWQDPEHLEIVRCCR